MLWTEACLAAALLQQLFKPLMASFGKRADRHNKTNRQKERIAVNFNENNDVAELDEMWHNGLARVGYRSHPEPRQK